uniref:Major facilitator superfamily (MFS) profile domain-containing protein n=1 Tax=Kalanchoe fedtschenkoi TaxID=63787 RepID=A0A7N0U9E0_KALFE
MESAQVKPQPFSLPVDDENKATVFRPFSLAAPHMRAFHLAWLSLFACFFSTFSIPPLIAVIRQDIKLTDRDISNAGVASFLGSIFSRLAFGPICDLFGPRLSSAALSLLTVPAVLAASLVTTPLEFIFVRFLIGFCLANFVANQFWMTSMFSGCVVGVANGVAAGWANTGSGVTQLAMPLIYTWIMNTGIQSSTAWRLSFIVPAMFQAATAVLVLLYGQDQPGGQHIQRSSGRNHKQENAYEVLAHGLKNYRGWILGLTYGCSFGVELTVDNIIAQYFYYRFDLNLQVAGAVAACFGLANIFSRPAGGVLSDKMARRYGIRGRLWSLWAVLTMAGLLCFLLGRADSLSGSVLLMCAFSLFVQAASGLTFGVVPFVSKSSLGVISGMTGSGGTVGAVVTQMLLFSGSKFSKQTSISLMGLMMIVFTLPVSSLYFPQEGGMFCGPSKALPSHCDDGYHHLLG